MDARLVALCFSFFGCSPMNWEVTHKTTVAELDARYRAEVAALHEFEMCGSRAEIVMLADCDRYHTIWRRYWSARRDLAELKGWQ